MTAWMDGTNSVEIVSGLSGPRGIAVDCESSRLFWTDIFEGSVKSNGLDGSNVTVLVKKAQFFEYLWSGAEFTLVLPAMADSLSSKVVTRWEGM